MLNYLFILGLLVFGTAVPIVLIAQALLRYAEGKDVHGAHVVHGGQEQIERLNARRSGHARAVKRSPRPSTEVPDGDPDKKPTIYQKSIISYNVGQQRRTMEVTDNLLTGEREVHMAESRVVKTQR